MELDNYIQIDSEYLQNQKFEAVLVVSNFESRCTYLASKINIEKIPLRIALAFSEHEKILACRKNDEKLQEKGFQFHKTSIGDTSSLSTIFEPFKKCHAEKTKNILVDFTCMPKVWYQEVIDYFTALECEVPNLDIWFAYSPAVYHKTPSCSGKISKDRMPKLPGKKPVALIIGIGTDQDCALDAMNALNPDVVYTYLANTDIDNRYTADVIARNEKLMRKIAPDKVVQYPMQDISLLSKLLTNQSVNLRTSHDVVLLPLGPKPFSLVCSVLASRFPDIHFWNIPTSISSNPVDKKPFGDIVLYKVSFTSEEVDY
jgi:hypothetical protein